MHNESKVVSAFAHFTGENIWRDKHADVYRAALLTSTMEQARPAVHVPHLTLTCARICHCQTNCAYNNNNNTLQLAQHDGVKLQRKKIRHASAIDASDFRCAPRNTARGRFQHASRSRVAVTRSQIRENATLQRHARPQRTPQRVESTVLLFSRDGNAVSIYILAFM